MCGIAGIMGNVDREKREMYISQILEQQHHRGPDYRGIYSVDQITLGHNRLAIIDLDSRSNQPFHSHCGRYTIVFNGEIYNYLELREELKLTYPFKTESDTEVLLASYIKWGVEALRYLNGMFAFAIYDQYKKELFCARDRIGEKPFLYSLHQTGFYFASELPALLRLGIFGTEPDQIGLHYSYLRNFLHIPEPYTRYKSIRRLEPAHALLVRKGKIVKKWCYWTPPTEYNPNITPEQVREVVKNGVKIRERADVEIATLLSGGIDSSIVTTLMVKDGLKPQAYTLKGDEEELGRAKLIATRLGIGLKIYNFDPQLQRQLYHKMVQIYGEEVRLLPLTHSARLYQQIRRDGIKVVMTGIGADELFYGYDGAYRQLLFSDIVKLLELFPRPFLKGLEKIFSFNQHLKLLFRLAQIENHKRKGFLYQQEAIKKGWGEEFDYAFLLDFWAEKVKTRNYIDLSHWLGLILENSHSITISGDLPAMMFSIETRAPFLDYRVIELAFQIDAHRKVSKNGGKMILKEAFKELLPDTILRAPKKGFGYGIKNNWVITSEGNRE